MTGAWDFSAAVADQLQVDLASGGRGTGLERLVEWESARAGLARDLSESTSPDAEAYLDGIAEKVAAGRSSPTTWSPLCNAIPPGGWLRRSPLQLVGEAALQLRPVSCGEAPRDDIDATLRSAAFGMSWRVTRIALASPTSPATGSETDYSPVFCKISLFLRTTWVSEKLRNHPKLWRSELFPYLTTVTPWRIS